MATRASDSAGSETASAAMRLSAARHWLRGALTEKMAGALVVALLAIAGQFYLAPASNMMWARDRDHIMSNGGDATALPFHYHVVRSVARESWFDLLYGSVHNPQLGPPTGGGMWVPWIERWLVVMFGAVLPDEAILTAFVWMLMVLAGVCFYAFARAEQWPRLLAFSFALAFAFNPYTRARAVVHAALVGIYCVPLIFCALRTLKRRATPKTIALCGALLIFALWTAHYYILMLAVISPLLLWFQLREDGERAGEQATRPQLARWTRLGVLALAAAPAVIFLAWNVLRPLPPSAPSAPPIAPTQELAQMYLHVYAARPVDYLSNDVALGSRDLNPVRRVLNVRVAKDLDSSNTHERANGIRWSILFPFLFLAAWCASPLRQKLRASLSPTVWRKLTYWMVFAAVMFWLSLSPSSLRVYGHELGPSNLVHEIAPGFRVPSRFGPFFHFAVLAAVGTFLSGHWNRWFGHSTPTWRRGLPCLLPVLMVLDYPPLLPVAIDQTLPPRLDLVAAGGGKCGVGTHFPYSPEQTEIYPAFQQLRDTDCGDIFQQRPSAFATALLDGLDDRAFNKASESEEQARVLQDRFIRFARCAKLDWVIFFPRVPEAWRLELCGALGWERIADDACASQAPRASQFPDPAPGCTHTLKE